MILILKSIAEKLNTNQKREQNKNLRPNFNIVPLILKDLTIKIENLRIYVKLQCNSSTHCDLHLFLVYAPNSTVQILWMGDGQPDSKEFIRSVSLPKY